ncbi:MAG: nucleotidyltransferase domain-containing protein [Sulfurovum sp.]|nr:nucleotidyltransferase domain-containing protein [Sulfurovaceae bacterium]
MLNQNIIISYLKERKVDFNTKYSIDKIGLFGSFATNKHTDTSDVDIVYQTSSKGLTFSQVSQLEDELHIEFGKDIDLVNLDYMNPLVKRKAIKDIIYV